MVEELVDLMHKTAPWVQIWLGGPEVSFDALDVLKRNPAVKLVMCGEGEETFMELLRGSLRGQRAKRKANRTAGRRAKQRANRIAGQRAKRRLTGLPGSTKSCKPAGISDEALEKKSMVLLFRTRKGMWFAQPRPVVDMDRIPFPYEDMENFKNKIIYYESSRGVRFLLAAIAFHLLTSSSGSAAFCL